MTKRNNTDYGMLDYHSYYNKNNSFKVDRKTFSNIVSELNKVVVDTMLENGKDFKLPSRCGAIVIRKTKRKVKMVDGKIVNTNPPDWKKTLKLWESDKESKEKKTIIRHSNIHTAGYVFQILYSRSTANFKNKTFYSFKAARNFKRDLAKRINNYIKPKFDSPKLY